MQKIMDIDLLKDINTFVIKFNNFKIKITPTDLLTLSQESDIGSCWLNDKIYTLPVSY